MAWVNPNPDAPIGKRGLIVTLDMVRLSWADAYCETGIGNDEDGHNNTQKLLDYGKAHGINFPAAEWCANYSKNGIKPGEGFLPSKTQLLLMASNRYVIIFALKKVCESVFYDWLWSSSEAYKGYAWIVYSSEAGVGRHNMTDKYYVRCVIAF